MLIFHFQGLAILASNSDESDEGGLAGSPPPRKKLRTATNLCPTVLSPNSTATMQQPQTVSYMNILKRNAGLNHLFFIQAKNGCSTFDTNNGSANDDTAGSSSTGTGSLLALKDVDGIVGGSRHYHDQGFTELDGPVQPKVISKLDQEIVRIIGQHLTTIGLQLV